MPPETPLADLSKRPLATKGVPEIPSPCRTRASKRPIPSKPTLLGQLNIGMNELSIAQKRATRSKTTYRTQHRAQATIPASEDAG